MIDISFFVVYILALLFVGFKAQRRNPTREEYLLSSRSLTLPAFVATLVTTWYGGILGIGEFIYLNGVSAWVIFGVPYYFFAALFSIFLAPKIRSEKYISIPDLLYQNYGKAAGLLGSFFILFITSPAPYILISAILIQYMLNIPFELSVLFALLFSVFYLFKGGFRSVVQTDKLQFALMFGGFIVLFSFLLFKFGSPLNYFEKLSPAHKSLTGGLSAQEIVVWFLIASWTFIDPGFHQRSAAAQSPQIAKKGVMISILFWFIFDMLTLLTGIYASILIQNSNPLMIYPLIAEQVLPPVLKSLFVLSLIATAMSTSDSFSFISAQTFGRDIIAYWNKKDSDSEIKHYTQIGLFFTAVFALFFIWIVPSVVKMWYTLGSLFIPPLLIPILLALYGKRKLNPKRSFILMLGSFLIPLGWYVFGFLNNGKYFLALEPFIPGLAFSIVFTILFIKKNPAKKRD